MRKQVKYWSLTWQPVMREMQHYECRHGLRIYQNYRCVCGHRNRNLYYVPLGKRYELWQVTMRNLSDRPRRLRVFSYVEFSWNDVRYDMLCHWPCMALMADFDTDRIVVDTVAEQRRVCRCTTTLPPICRWMVMTAA